MGVLLLVHVLLVAVAASAPAADAWGKEGHYMVCKIAEVTENLLEFCLTQKHTAKQGRWGS